MSRHVVNISQGRKRLSLAIGMDPVNGQLFYSVMNSAGVLLGNSTTGIPLPKVMSHHKIEMSALSEFMSKALPAIEKEEFQYDLKRLGASLPAGHEPLDLGRVVNYPDINLSKPTVSSPSFG